MGVGVRDSYCVHVNTDKPERQRCVCVFLSKQQCVGLQMQVLCIDLCVWVRRSLLDFVYALYIILQKHFAQVMYKSCVSETINEASTQIFLTCFEIYFTQTQNA